VASAIGMLGWVVAACAASRAGETPIQIQVLDAGGSVVARGGSPDGPGDRTAALTFDRDYQKGDRLVITGPKHMLIRLDERAADVLVFAPDGRVDYRIPHGVERRAYARDAFAGTRHTVAARPGAIVAMSGDRDVALNPYDQRGDVGFFPHATSNSECRNDPVFAARNAIDGETKNARHGGWPHQSWGPDQRTDLWWKLDFGRPVAIDRVELVIRADFPHDKHWHAATIEFSDGSAEKIAIQKTAEKQAFPFKRRTVNWLRFTNLVQEEPLGWCAFIEVEAWGRDAQPTGSD